MFCELFLSKAVIRGKKNLTYGFIVFLSFLSIVLMRKKPLKIYKHKIRLLEEFQHE